ncbi:MAG: Mbov_0396 family ICE element transmembrane protein [Candidatus Coproplasma sp.]
MFDWFWEFLYSLSKTIFKLIDGLVACANMLCGIDPVKIDGKEADFMYYLFSNEKISFAFRVAAVLGMIVLVIFTIFAIIRSIVREKPEGTPGQICFKAFKSFLTFLFVPACMFAIIWLGNEFMKAMYTATLSGGKSIGTFLFVTFAQDGGMDNANAQQFIDGVYDYYNTAHVSAGMVASGKELSDFSFLYSWLAGGVILVSLATSMVLFVDRVLSIVILYIVAPFSISTTVLDDGAHFKLWRDQIMVKFFMGYGAIIALNIYALVVSLVSNPELVFFESSFLNSLIKLLFIGGGALTLKKSMGLIGNLVQAGAGSNEMRDNAISAASLGRTLSGIGGKVAGGLATVSGLNYAKDVISGAWGMKKRDNSVGLLHKLGMSPKYDASGRLMGDSNASDKGSDSQNSEQPNFGKNANDVANAIKGEDKKESDNKNDNKQSIGNNMVDNAINNKDNSSKEPDDPNDFIEIKL